LTADDLDKHFPMGQDHNIGILNGAPSGNTVDVDLDCIEARLAAPFLLPATGWRFGRKSAPGSHWIYRTHHPLDTATKNYDDLGGNRLCEARGSGGQTVFPPSTHEDTGEEICWESVTTPAELDLGDLLRSVGAVGAAALLARHWPTKGSRDAAAMALTGGLTRAGWTKERIGQFVMAVAVAAGDEEARKRSSKAERTAEALGDGKRVYGWPSLAKALGFDGDAVVSQVCDWLGVQTRNRIEDFSIVEPPPWPTPPAEEAFHGLAGQIARTIDPASEADPVALVAQTLVAYGNCIGRSAHFTVEADTHFTNEFAVLVGRTSKARKGSSWGYIRRLFTEADEQWANTRIQSGVSSAEGLLWAVRDPIFKREKIKEDGQVRYEEVEADPGVEDKRILIYEPEYANVLKQCERLGNTVTVTMRQAWDGIAVLRSLVKNSPTCSTGAHMSMVAHITSEELRRYLTVTEIANGWANRFMLFCTDRSKVLPEGGQVDLVAWQALQKQLTAALAFGRAVGEVKRDERARALWVKVYPELSEGRPGLAGALLARGEAHVMRLAMLYALLDCSAVITEDHLMAALALWDYVERSVAFVFGDSLGNAVADDLLRLLRSCPEGLTRTEISSYFQRNYSAERIGQALGLLLQHKLVRRDQEKTEGRPAERWFATGSTRQGT
jgi:hypothetical protein